MNRQIKKQCRCEQCTEAAMVKGDDVPMAEVEVWDERPSLGAQKPRWVALCRECARRVWGEEEV